jgi:hypothetical protein
MTGAGIMSIAHHRPHGSMCTTDVARDVVDRRLRFDPSDGDPSSCDRHASPHGRSGG